MGARLADSDSAYLRQHADDPVDWHPWGEEAFRLAYELDRPVFLSIGYSSCHWCHVMQEESFRDHEVAALLNGSFVPVKVDREERPDVDHAYMTITVAMSGSGGWPMSLFLTPEGEPFLATTYIPREGRYGRRGMLELLPAVAEAWTDRREELVSAAGATVSALQELAGRPAGGGGPDGSQAEAARSRLLAAYDQEHGGFGGAPKFPSAHTLLFLLDRWRRQGDEEALAMAAGTLEAIRRGGIHDHLAGGFHRYSTDARWLVPHFEKMLCDQAMLAMAFTEGHRDAGLDGRFRAAAERTADFVLERMTGGEGTFFSSMDADSEGEEGRYYLWTAEEVLSLLGPELAGPALRRWGVTPAGSFPEEGGPPAGRNVLYEAATPAELAEGMGEDAGELAARLDGAERVLLEARRQRVPPRTDTRVLTDWNGLMVAALARAGRTLGTARYTAAAGRAADVLLERHVREDGRLLHATGGSGGGVPAMLDDYAFLAWGLLELYAAEHAPGRLKAALGLLEEAGVLLRDDDTGGYMHAPRAGVPLPLRRKPLQDGAIPSGNSVMLRDLVMAWKLTGDGSLREAADGLAAFALPEVERAPAAHAAMLEAMELLRSPGDDLVVTAGGAEESREMVEVAERHVPPGTALHVMLPGSAAALVRLAPHLETMVPGPEDGVRAYLCSRFACARPTASPGELRGLLRRRALTEGENG